MNKFDLTDDYLTKRLEAADKVEFEKELAADPALRKEFDFQQHLVEGIKKSRAAELKAKLNQIEIPSAPSYHLTVAKIAAGIIAIGVVTAAVYLSVRSKNIPEMTNAAADLMKKKEQLQKAIEVPTNDPAIVPIPTAPKDEVPAQAGEEKPAELERKSAVTKPNIELAYPSEQLSESSQQPGVPEPSSKPVISASSIAVDIDRANKTFQFHYQFAGGKLYLFGPFDQGLYEILEVNGDNHMVFLYFKDNYYQLDEKQLRITALEPIADRALVDKLRQYRGK